MSINITKLSVHPPAVSKIDRWLGPMTIELPHPLPADGASAAANAEPKPQIPATRPGITLTSEDLLQGRTEILIRHGDETYRLRQTRNGKLILQK